MKMGIKFIVMEGCRISPDSSCGFRVISSAVADGSIAAYQSADQIRQMGKIHAWCSQVSPDAPEHMGRLSCLMRHRSA